MRRRRHNQDFLERSNEGEQLNLQKSFPFNRVIVLALIMIFVLPAIGVCQNLRWKFGTLAPDGVGWARQIKRIVIPAVMEISENTLDVKVYWGGIMGDDEDYIKKMRIGQLQGAGLSGQGVTMAVPEMAVVELPFLLRSFDEVDYIKSKMRDTFDAIAKENGYMMITWIDQDFDLIYSTKWDMTDAAHFQSAKFLAWFGPVEGYVLQGLGSTPVPVNIPEAPSSLRQGIGDTIIAPAAWMVGTQLYSVVRYVSPLNIRYSPAMVVVTQDAWNQFDERYQKGYRAVRDDVEARFCKELRNDNKTSLDAMIKYGLKMSAPSAGVISTVEKQAKQTWRQMAGQLYPESLLDQVLAHLDEYRAKQ